MYGIEKEVQIEIANLQSEVTVDEELLYKLVYFILNKENIESAEISIALLQEDEMKRLNRDYRDVDEATDVLSFTLDLDPLVGEIILSPSYIKRQAEEYQMTFEHELVMLTIHGLLHMIGYDHEASEREAGEMWSRQKELERNFWMQDSIL